MPRRRADQAPLGFTSNGILLVNVLAQLSEAQAATLRKALPAEFGADWFIGVAVDPHSSRAALVRLDDAAAETAARLVAAAAKGTTTPRSKTSKPTPASRKRPVRK